MQDFSDAIGWPSIGIGTLVALLADQFGRLPKWTDYPSGSGQLNFTVTKSDLEVNDMYGLNTNFSRSLVPHAFNAASREMDELFERLFQSDGGAAAKNGNASRLIPPMSAWETTDHFFVEIDLPGIAEDDLDVSFESGSLRIRAHREWGNPDQEKRLYDERYWGSIEREIKTPESIDPESIEADYSAGVLRVTMSKRPEVLPKKITVKAKSWTSSSYS